MGTVANQALQLMHKGSLEITFTVPLMKERKHAFGRKKNSVEHLSRCGNFEIHI